MNRSAPARLIVTADDFGLTDGVCEGILEAYEAGSVTATSVLAVGRALDRHGARLAATPGLAVGLHLAFVGEDRPVLSAAEVPSLVNRRGMFPLDWRRFAMRSAAGRVDPDDLRREASAQLDRLRSTGVNVRHMNCHQNLQLWPSVARVVTDLAHNEDIGVLRVTGGDRLSARSALVAIPAHRLAHQVADSGCHAPQMVVGLTGAGAMTGDRLRAALDHVAAHAKGGVAELVLHPGRPDDPDRTRYRWGYQWDAEWQSLVDGSLVAEMASRSIHPVAPSELITD